MYYFQSALVVGGICLIVSALLRLAEHVKVLRNQQTSSRLTQGDV
jgi:hypothetical protein